MISLASVKLSIVIVCWNDRERMQDCLRSIFSGGSNPEFEVIVSDNGSTDGLAEWVRREYPQVRLVENGSNLGCAAGLNSGIRQSSGEYVLVLNPDAVVHDGALAALVACAERHPEAGAFGCRILNADGREQQPGLPFPSLWREWIDALGLHRVARLVIPIARLLQGDSAADRPIPWPSGCCALFRADVVTALGGFDDQFFYTYDEVDLCWRMRARGYSAFYTPLAVVTHVGGQSARPFPIRFELERYRNRYRYYYKHFGARRLPAVRRAVQVRLRVRQLAYGFLNLFSSAETVRQRVEVLGVVARWNKALDPVQFVEKGEEPASETPAGSRAERRQPQA
jgi:N-acetylglucosaminyl-diphospho-decaprenol L-rhamnosyltransferase